MGKMYTLQNLESLSLSADRKQFLPCELSVCDETGIQVGTVHSSQLAIGAREVQGNFKLRESKSDTMSIQDLAIYEELAGNRISYRFIVPLFQRGYRWETIQVSELLDDIYTNFKKYYNPSKNSKPSEDGNWYCIQPLVLKNTQGKLNEFRVIDGQQRITTLALLLKALYSQIPAKHRTPRNAYIPIGYEARKTSEDFLNEITEKYKDTIQKITGNSSFANETVEKKLKLTLDNIAEKPDDINAQYMLNTYLYAYWYFWERINGAGTGTSYFEFAEIYKGYEWNKDEQWEPKRFALLESMLLDYTAVIWYQIDDSGSDEHKVFEDFNSGKISLTGAELVKGVFMNPDNYIDYSEGGAEQYEKVKKQLETRQIMFGAQWDEIERALHEDEFWHFIPHLDDKEGENEKATRIDAIFNMHTYFNLMGKGNEGFNTEDNLFSYKKINAWIGEYLQKKEDKFETMWKLWIQIKDVYTIFHEWFTGDTTLENKNSLYHRLSLFKRIIVNSRMNYATRYQTQLSRIKPLYASIANCNKQEREKIVNKFILEALGVPCNGNDAIKNFIVHTTYDKDTAVEAILLAFNLNTLETAKSYGRFPFDIFDKEDWQKEHIFATNTDISAEEVLNTNELLSFIVSDTESKSFEEYHALIEETINEDQQTTLNDIQSIINMQVPDEALKQKLLGKDGTVLKNILRDNHMGNMALLIKRDNIIVSNDSYFKKYEKIKQLFKTGRFIPICTMNVFSGFYHENEGTDMAGRYRYHWLYEGRLAYLNEMLTSVTNYLQIPSGGANE